MSTSFATSALLALASALLGLGHSSSALPRHLTLTVVHEAALWSSLQRTVEIPRVISHRGHFNHRRVSWSVGTHDGCRIRSNFDHVC